MKIKIAEMYTVERDSKEIVMEERFMYCDPEGRAVDPHDIELRYNHNHDSKGRFASGSGGGGAVKKSIDKSSGSGKIEKRPKSMKIGKKERERLRHQIATDFPNLKPDGEIHNYENRNHFYRFSVNSLGDYSYHLKIKITGNEDYINIIRKKGK